MIAEPLRLVRYGIQSPTKQERQAFDCGTEALDRWLHTQAGQSERSHDAATYLLVRDREIVGYYALAAASISSASADPTLRKGAPAEIPAILLGRLAVASKEQGQGLGALLLREAVAASLQAGEVVGARLMLVDAIDDNAAAFYRRWGFRAGAGPARTLMARIADLQVSVPRTEPRTYHGIRVPEGWFDLGWGPFLGSTDGAGGLIRVRTPPAPYVALLSTHGSEEGAACASARYSRRCWGSVARS